MAAAGLPIRSQAQPAAAPAVTAQAIPTTVHSQALE